MSCSKNIDSKFDVTFQVQLPDEWNTSLGKKNIGITAAVETDVCNPKWLENCKSIFFSIRLTGLKNFLISEACFLVSFGSRNLQPLTNNNFFFFQKSSGINSDKDFIPA